MEKEIIIVRYFSKVHHCSQVVTGISSFCKEHQKYRIVFENHIDDTRYPYKGPIIEVHFKEKTIVYDMYDGYNDIDTIKWFYNKSDFYFKRSFSTKYNDYHGFNSNKIYPYGFNYFVTYKGNPLDGSRIKDIIKGLLGRNHNTHFLTKTFETKPVYNKSPKVLFSVRLWPEDHSLGDKLNEERRKINEMRIRIAKELKSTFGDNFIGGLYDTPLARQLAPDLILPPYFTIKKNYIAIMKQCDICIGTMGLHESIGGKTGEYIAASKALVLEKLHYSVPGPFINGVNYLEFIDANQCIAAVKTLYNSPCKTYAMKRANSIYYEKWLKPGVLIENSLNLINLL